MTPEVLLSFARQALMFGGGFLVTRGVIDADTLNTVIGAVITLVSSGFSIWAARSSSAAKGKI